jgi:hypothetical protein
MFMVVGEALLFLTQKGTEELRNRAHKLDLAARNILFLIERGSTSTDAILRRSVFPRDKVIDRLGRLMSNEFVAVSIVAGERPRVLGELALGELAPTLGDLTPTPGALPPTRGEPAPTLGEAPLTQGQPRGVPGTQDFAASPPTEPMSLEEGISIAQARFALSDFCLDHLEQRGPELAIAIKRCTDVAGLQKVLDRMCDALERRCPERLPKLQGCVREINQTNI